jgi:methenyltetrahydrofolate cyclohydrolase
MAVAEVELNSLWALSSGDLVARVALPKPVPGSGSVAMIVGCLGAALLEKAFALSERRSRQTERSGLLEEPYRELRRLHRMVRALADQDAAAFTAYVCALRLPRENSEQHELRTKEVEHTLVRATETLIAGAARLAAMARLTQNVFFSIRQAIRSDAVAGLRLIHGGATTLLDTADDNLRGLSGSLDAAHLAKQVHGLRGEILRAEALLAAKLRKRSGLPGKKSPQGVESVRAGQGA